MYELYVKNEKEDLIGEVTLKQEEEMEENLPEAGKLVINGYSKDTKVLAFSSNKGGLVMRATNSDGQRKLAGFGKYLLERKKAGIVNLPRSDALYILPPTAKDQVSELRCVKQSSMNSTTVSSTTASAPSSAPPSSSSKKDVKKENIKKTDFLSSLLGKMESTNKVATKPRPKEVENVLTVTDRQTRELLDALVQDKSRTELQMELMDKEKRRLVHDIVGNDYPAFVSCSVGDFDDEKFVMVYLKGHEPEGVELASIGRVHMSSSRTTTNKSTSAKGTVKKGHTVDMPKEELVQVHQVKRDRRTIEEIEQDMRYEAKKRKI